MAGVCLFSNSCSDMLNIESKTDITTSYIFNSKHGLESAVVALYYQDRFMASENNNYEFIIQMDADGQHDVCNIGTIYNKLTHGKHPYDIVIGSRFIGERKSSMQVGIAKKVAIGFFNMAIRLVTKKQFTDPTSGLQGLSRRAFTAYSLYDNFDTNYPDANIITKMLLNGYWLREVPAVMHERKSGVSMHSGLRKNIAYMFTVTLNILVVVTQFYLIKKGHKDITEELDLT